MTGKSMFAVAGLAVLAAACSAEGPEFGQLEQGLLGYPDATWNPAHSSNYAAGNRGVGDITEIVVHTMEGTYAGSQAWFQDPAANVSTHYLIRSSDGDITQMVDDSDYGFHVFCLNESSIGIEHEGYVGEGATWYTQAMYEASARLSAWLVNQYLIPLDRQHILGHDESGCTTHNDPGSMWDWNKYMALIEQYAVRQHGASLVSVDAPAQMSAGEFKNVTITLRNEGNYTWEQATVLLGTQDPADHSSPFGSEYWSAPSRAGGPKIKNNFPGDDIAFTFPVKAPSLRETTTLTETLQLVDGDGMWFGPKVSFSIEVLGDGMGAGSDAGIGGGGDGEPGGCGCRSGAGGESGAALILLSALALYPWRRRAARLRH